MLVFCAIRNIMARIHLQRMASLCWPSRSVKLQLFVEPPNLSKAFISCKFIHQEQSILGRRGSCPEFRFISTHSTGLHGIGPIPPFYSDHLWVACGVRNFTIKENGDQKEVSIPKEGPEVEKSQHKKVLEGGAKYSVLRINSDGAMSSLSLKSSELVSSQLWTMWLTHPLCSWRYTVGCLLILCKWNVSFFLWGPAHEYYMWNIEGLISGCWQRITSSFFPLNVKALSGSCDAGREYIQGMLICWLHPSPLYLNEPPYRCEMRRCAPA